MERTYDIFEVDPNGSLLWQGALSGLEPALARMRELAAQSQNGFVLVHLETNSLIAVVDSKQGPPLPKKIRQFTQKDPKKNRSALRQRARRRRRLTPHQSIRAIPSRPGASSRHG